MKKFIAVFLLLSCSCIKNDKKQVVFKQDSIHRHTVRTNEVNDCVCVEHPTKITMSFLKGTWKVGTKADFSVFQIKDEKIIYTDFQDTPYSILIKNDSLSIIYDGYIHTGFPVICNDSCFSILYKQENTPECFCRFKE